MKRENVAEAGKLNYQIEQLKKESKALFDLPSRDLHVQIHPGHGLGVKLYLQSEEVILGVKRALISGLESQIQAIETQLQALL